MRLCRQAALCILLVASSLAALPRGGTPVWAQATACAACALAFLLSALGEEEGSKVPPAAIPLGVAALFAALQCVPLPAAVVAALAPASWEIRSLSPAPRPSWAPLSLDVPATLAALALPATAAFAACAAGILAARDSARRLLCAAPIFAALLQALLAFALKAAGIQQPLGAKDVAPPDLAAPFGQLMGSFVNRNHQAALLGFGALVALGAALGSPRAAAGQGPPSRALFGRVAWALAAIACASACLLSLSRGGAISLALGTILLAVLRRSRPDVRIAAPAILLCALGVGVFLSADALRGRAGDLALSRLQEDQRPRSFVGAARVVRDHWLTGVGRGAWRFASERHRSVPGDGSYDFVENEPLQAFAELGLPVGLFVLGLLAASWLRALGGPPRRGIEHGVLAGLAALALHNLTDFNLELLGVALPAAVAFGAVSANPQAGGTARPGRLRRKIVSALLPVLAAPLCVLALLDGSAHSASEEGAALLRVAQDPRAQRAEDALRAAVLRHPADWLISLAPAMALHARTPPRPEEALAWVNRALWLAPQAWRPHAVAAVVLLRMGARSQAALEARLALAERRSNTTPQEVMDLVVRNWKGVDDLFAATPDEPRVRAALAERLYGARRLAEARAVAERELVPASTDPRTHAALLLLLAQVSLEERDIEGALAWTEQLARAQPSSCAAALWRSRALLAAAKPPEPIEAELSRGLAICPRDRSLGEELVRRKLDRGDPVGAEAALLSLDGEAPDSGWAAGAHLLHAVVLEAQGWPTRGLAHRWLAALIGHDRPDLALDYANRLAARGEIAAAAEALRQLASRATPSARPPLEARLGELERAAAESRTSRAR